MYPSVQIYDPFASSEARELNQPLLAGEVLVSMTLGLGV